MPFNKSPTYSSAASAGIIFAKDDQNVVKLIGTTADLQVGSPSAPKNLCLTGKLSLSFKKVSLTAGSSCVLQSEDTVNAVELSGSGLVIVYLPVGPRIGQTVIVKDVLGLASSNNILIKTSDQTLIDGLELSTISNNYGYQQLVWTGNVWSIIGKY